jgi:hypothetical protein
MSTQIPENKLREAIALSNAAADILDKAVVMLREEPLLPGVGDAAAIALGYDPKTSKEYQLASEASFMLFIVGATREGRDMHTNENTIWAFGKASKHLRTIASQEAARLSQLETAVEA